MTGWRAKAAEMLPELGDVLDDAWSIHIFLIELHELVVEAHRACDADILRRGYGFAAWCLRQPERFLANAAAVSFYEHVFDRWEDRDDVVGWLPDGVTELVRPLWEWRLPADRMSEVDRLIGGRVRMA